MTYLAGAVVAASLSWAVHGSYVRAIMHGALSWVYVMYWVAV